MPNRIRDIAVTNHRLDPKETELRVFVAVDSLTPTTEIKGRLMGPRCVYSSTVEVSYPMREIARTDRIVLRVIIPEPCWWDPQSPFLYQGPLELWQDGQLCERAQISHGIRWIQISANGLRLNGRPFLLRGKAIDQHAMDAQARQLHDDGMNSALIALPTFGADLWSLADRYGFFVIGWKISAADFLLRKNIANARPSAFGWILQPELIDPSVLHHGETGYHFSSLVQYGVEGAASIPARATFLVCQEDDLPSLAVDNLPKLVLTKRLAESLPSRPDVIGWIETT